MLPVLLATFALLISLANSPHLQPSTSNALGVHMVHLPARAFPSPPRVIRIDPAPEVDAADSPAHFDSSPRLVGPATDPTPTRGSRYHAWSQALGTVMIHGVVALSLVLFGVVLGLALASSRHERPAYIEPQSQLEDGTGRPTTLTPQPRTPSPTPSPSPPRTPQRENDGLYDAVASVLTTRMRPARSMRSISSPIPFRVDPADAALHPVDFDLPPQGEEEAIRHLVFQELDRFAETVVTSKTVGEDIEDDAETPKSLGTTGTALGEASGTASPLTSAAAGSEDAERLSVLERVRLWERTTVVEGKGKERAEENDPTVQGYVKTALKAWAQGPPGLVPDATWAELRGREELVSGAAVAEKHKITDEEWRVLTSDVDVGACPALD
ncbi:hypothetical protein C8R46DRAFT_664825 [Mycena filopes]|nr:hypothetical protein C8R46DRAFT_664825 [Mycena filopes]